MSRRLVALLKSPGARPAIAVSAPSVIETREQSHNTPASDEEKIGADDKKSDEPTVQVINGEVTKRRLDVWLDKVVHWSGSPAFFLITVAGLIAWAGLGIAGYSDDANWNVLISDIQAVGSYILDTFLLRQSLTAHDNVLIVTGVLQSRGASVERMLAGLARGPHPETGVVDRVVIDVAMPRESLFGRICKRASHAFGHLFTLIIFWTAVAVWLGLGPANDWSDDWQLLMNSASSALMVLIFVFLACIRERHAEYVKVCMDKILQTDVELETSLRVLTGDAQPNPTVVMPSPIMGRLQRAIAYYAELVGSLAGIVILVIVFIIWVAFGPLLDFSANWWLLIGTYAGLIGMNDGVVMRNLSQQFSLREDTQTARLQERDAACMALTRIREETKVQAPVSTSTWQRIGRAINRLTLRLSHCTEAICAHRYAVVAGLAIIIALLATATAMGWNLTGQLICNTPPSIIESFIMLVVISGDNSTDDRIRAELTAIYERRAILLAYARHLEHYGPTTAIAFEPKIIGRVGRADSAEPSV